MVYRRRYAPYTTSTRSQLATFSEKDSKAFDAWMSEYVKDNSQPDLQNCLPSSQLPPKASYVQPERAQLFAVVDTCTLVKYRLSFMKFITELRRSYSEVLCPVKFIMPLVVLEELDKCNRPAKKQAPQSIQHQQQQQVPDIKPEPDNSQPSGKREVPIADLLRSEAPPRSFGRFIDHEMRAGLIIGDLDPYKSQQLPPMEIVNHDDRILASALRNKMFVQKHSQHPETRVVLVTEDNNFKSKATTYEMASFRWREFEAKYHNFGRKHCVATPLVHKLNLQDHNANQLLDQQTVARQPLATQPTVNLVMPWIPVVTSLPSASGREPEVTKSDKPVDTPNSANNTSNTNDVKAPERKHSKRGTSLKIKAIRTMFSGRETGEEISIIRERAQMHDN